MPFVANTFVASITEVIPVSTYKLLTFARDFFVAMPVSSMEAVDRNAAKMGID